MIKFDIPGFSDYELIDFDTSEIIVKKTTGQVMKVGLNNKDYYSIQLRANKKRKRLTIHKIKYICHYGLDTSLDGYNSEFTLDHSNDNKHDNRIRNIRKITRKENTQKRYI